MPAKDYKSIANIIGLTSLDLNNCRSVDNSIMEVKNKEYLLKIKIIKNRKINKKIKKIKKINII